MDPLTASYPWYTPYQFAGNKPIRFTDRDGAEEWDSMWEMFKNYLFGESAISNKGDNSESAKQKRTESKEFINIALESTKKVAKAYNDIYGTILPGFSSGFEASQGNYSQASILLILDVAGGIGSKGKVANQACGEICEEGYITLYRAISTKELVDIVEKRAFDFAPGMTEAKYFSKSAEDAFLQGVANKKIKDNFLIVSTTIPKTTLDNFTTKMLDEDLGMKLESVIVEQRDQLKLLNDAVESITVLGKSKK